MAAAIKLVVHPIDALFHEPVEFRHGDAVAVELAEHRLGFAVPAV
jgi:hypothetical protein